MNQEIWTFYHKVFTEWKLNTKLSEIKAHESIAMENVHSRVS